MNEYIKQANDFAKKYGVKLSVISSKRTTMWGETQVRTVFKLKLSRKGKSYTFDFGQSIVNGDYRPSMYDILACLQKNDVGSFEDFCGEFGYNEDSRNAEKTYKAVCKEFSAVNRLFGDILDEMQEIQ